MTDNERNWVEIARMSDLDPEFPQRVEVDGVELAVGRIDTAPFAIFNICSHAFARLSDGFVEGCEIICPLHQGSFDVRTGQAVASPCYEPLKVYPVKVENDLVYLDATALHD